MVLDNLVQKNPKREKSEGRPPKHLEKPLKRKKDSRPIKDKWDAYRPLRRTWKCEKCNFTIKRDPDIDSIDYPCPCGGRFLSTQIIEKASKDSDTEYGLILFLESRKGNGKQQCQDILQIIFEKENEDIEGFVAFRDIYHGINSKYKVSRNEITRLLTDMEKNHIVYKIIRENQSVKTPNKNRIYYKFNSLALVEGDN